MNIIDAAGEIRRNVTMEQVLNLYGYQAKNGFMVCPFHADKGPSLRIYPKSGGWHCFGCQRGGSVIDFVMEHEGCGFKGAVTAIDAALKLGLTEAPDPLEERFTRQIRRITDEMAEVLGLMITLKEAEIEQEITESLQVLRDAEAVPKSERTAEQWDRITGIVEEMKYAEYRKAQCGKLREEVREWRQKTLTTAARARSA